MIRRLYRKGDEYQINELYNLVFNKDRSIDEWRWEYIANPTPDSFIWLMEDSGKIVGHFSLLPIQLRFGGKLILSGKTENTMIHPEYRGKGYWVPFEKECIQESHKSGLILPWVTFSEATGAHMRSGYIPIAPIVSYLKTTNHRRLSSLLFSKLNQRIRNRLISRLISLFFFISLLFLLLIRKVMNKQTTLSGNLNIREVTEFNNRFDEFWADNHKYYGITIDRYSRYLDWRFVKNPNLDYKIFVLETPGHKMLGYLILHEGHEGEVTLVDDIIVEGRKPELYGALLSYAENYSRAHNITMIQIVTLESDTFSANILEKYGYFSIDKMRLKLKLKREISNSYFLINPDRNLDDSFFASLTNGKNWYLTRIFTEGNR